MLILIFSVLTYHYESNISTEFNNLPTTHTTIRKPNTLTLKPLKKKSKLNGSNESTVSLVSSRLHGHEEQMNSVDEISTINNNQNNSINQITPRARMHLVQPHKVKQKPTAFSSNYSHLNDENDRKLFQTRTNLERQHHLPLTIQPRRGVLQQMLPFDASPAKVNNLLLRHQLQQPQTFYSSKRKILFSLIDIKIHVLTIKNIENIEKSNTRIKYETSTVFI